MSNLSDLMPPRLGPSGTSGSSGHSGASAYSGVSAYSGSSGTSGTSGVSGQVGNSGYSGFTGLSGTSGYSGTTGTSAYSGFSGGASTTANLEVTVTAGEALSSRDFVYVAPSTGAGLTAGQAYKADSDSIKSSTWGFYMGFVVSNISAGATGSVRIMGTMTGFTVTAGAAQYLSATAGGITETLPTNYLLVGIALDSSTILINSFGSDTAMAETGGKKGYFSGGDTNTSSGHVATTDKVTFATDVTTAATTANLSQARNTPAGISMAFSQKGYFGGGNTGAGVAVKTSDKVTFSSDVTVAVTTANLTTAWAWLGGVSEGNTKGYFVGGYAGPGQTANKDKITYSTDTSGSLTSLALSDPETVVGVTESFTKGYFIGTTTHDSNKLTYSNDTNAACTTADLTTVKVDFASSSDGSVAGYMAGGVAPPLPSNTSNKLTFSNDTTSTMASTLTSTRDSLVAVSGGNVAGYFAGGWTGGGALLASADKLTYSSDTFAACTTANLTAGKLYAIGISDVGW